MERQQATGSQTAQEVSVKVRSSSARRVQFIDAREEYEPCSDCSSGDEKLSGESSHIGPGQDDLSEEFTLKRRGTKFCPGSRETSRTNQMAAMQTPSARVMGQSLSLGKTCRRLPPIPTSRRLRFISC